MRRRAERTVRRSVSLPSRVARKVGALARNVNKSTSRVIVELIETALDAQQRERERFFELTDRLTRSRDRDEQKLLKEELARMTFGN
ncbi:MAG TPA: hypothetical protein VGL15_07795 [Vicinamibacteria bacterium]